MIQDQQDELEITLKELTRIEKENTEQNESRRE